MSHKLATYFAIGLCLGLFPAVAQAQAVTHVVFSPPVTTFVQPVQPVAAVQPVTTLRPVTVVQPATVVFRPVMRPLTTVAAPATQTVFFAPQPVVVARQTIPVVPVTRAPVVTTRHRPILGGTVTRVWYP